MADDPIDHLISATLAIEGEEAKAQRPPLPFAGNASSAAAPPAAPIDSFHVDSGTVSEANPWPPEEAGRQAAASRPARVGPALPVAQWLPPPPPAPVASAPAVYAASVGMPSAMPAMIARVVAGSQEQQPAAPPPRISDAALARGATASAYAASNAATESPGLRQLEPSAHAAPRLASERIDYLWHDKLAEADILRAPSLQNEEPQDDGDQWLTPEHALPIASKETAGIHEILTQRTPKTIDEVTSLYEQTLDAGVERVHCLVRGDLTLSFEPIEALRATLSVVTPLLSDARVKDAYEAAQEALRTNGGIAPAIASSHKERLDDALRAALRGSYATIESVIDRALIEGRSFSRRKVFGGNFIRALLCRPGRGAGSSQPANQGVPAYVPEGGAEELPLMRSVTMRLIVEVRPAQDAVETHPLALRVVAMGRVVDLGARRR